MDCIALAASSSSSTQILFAFYTYVLLTFAVSLITSSHINNAYMQHSLHYICTGFGVITSDHVERGFRRVDRKFFVPAVRVMHSYPQH